MGDVIPPGLHQHNEESNECICKVAKPQLEMHLIYEHSGVILLGLNISNRLQQ